MLVSEARGLLQSRAELEANGLTARALTAAVRDGAVVRVHSGYYVAGDVWREQYAEGRHLLQVVAAHDRRGAGGAVASHASAGVVHELTLFRYVPERVHVSGVTTDGRVRALNRSVARHEIPVPDADVVVVDGIPCTNLARTVADIIRTLPLEPALAAADAALRQVAWDAERRCYDERADAGFREEVREHMERHRRARGVRQGRQVLELADGRAESPGESVSRLYLRDLGFRMLRLQVPVPAPSGRFYYPDFGLDDVPAWGEFDGVGKYQELARQQGMTVEQVLLAEKQREDWIRGTTNRPFARWGMEHIRSALTLRQRLASFHMHPPR